jgi:hypothetical protein
MRPSTWRLINPPVQWGTCLGAAGGNAGVGRAPTGDDDPHDLVVVSRLAGQTVREK